MATAKSDEVVIPATRVRPDEDTLRGLNTIQDAYALLESANIPLRHIGDEIGSGFSVTDKETLVKVPMVLISWEFTVGDFGGMVIIHAMTEDGRKALIVDGSTGIYEQLELYTNGRHDEDNDIPGTGVQRGMYVPKGLRVSRYEMKKGTTEIAPRGYEGETTPAATFYLDTSK